MIPALARISERAYLPATAGGDPHRSRDGSVIESTVVPAPPEPWFAVRVEIVAGNGQHAAAPQSASLGYRSAGPSALLSAGQTSEHAALEPTALASALAPTPAPAASAGRVSAAEGSRAIAAYTAAMLHVDESERANGPGQRVRIRA